MVKSFMKQAEGAIKEESVNVFIQAVKGTVRLLRDGDFTQDDIDAVRVSRFCGTVAQLIPVLREVTNQSA
jgi:predicted transcriptional regulator